METLKYKVITSEKLYLKYCKVLEELIFVGNKSKHVKEEIALLTLLIEKWDEEHRTFHQLVPTVYSLANGIRLLSTVMFGPTNVFAAMAVFALVA